MKLISQGKGLSHYVTDCGRFRVVKREGRSWNGRIGSHAWTEWVALSVADNGADGFPLLIVKSESFAGVQKKLAKFIANESTGAASV